MHSIFSSSTVCLVDGYYSMPHRCAPILLISKCHFLGYRMKKLRPGTDGITHLALLPLLLCHLNLSHTVVRVLNDYIHTMFWHSVLRIHICALDADTKESVRMVTSDSVVMTSTDQVHTQSKCSVKSRKRPATQSEAASRKKKYLDR